MPDDIQERVLRAFQQEHREHIAAIRALLETWQNLTPEAGNEIFRLAHSLKGGARVCDLPPVEQLAHFLETLFAQVARGERPAEAGAAERIEEVLSAIEDYMAALAEQRAPEEPSALLARLAPGTRGTAAPERPAARPSPGSAAPPPPVSLREAKPSAPAAAPAKESIRPGPAVQDTVRVRAAHLDQINQTTPRLYAEAYRQDAIRGEFKSLLAQLAALQKQCDSLQARPESHGAANTPGAGESPLRDLQRDLGALMRSARKARALQSQSASSLRIVSEQLERDIRRARMVPVGSVLEGFPKMVRDLARSEGREVEFTAAGLDAEADRLVLQALKDPIMHALRNAVSHGLETPAERAAAGKSEKGRVTLTVEVAGSQLTLIVEDDGHGIDLRRVRKQAVERRLISAEEAASLRPDETRALLFQPGFSTAPTVTAVSGRGFGLSVVKETVARLQGFTRIEPLPKGGTRLRMVVPLAAASQRLLLARAGEHVFAIPARAIERVLSIPASETRVLDGKSTAWIDGQSVPLASLAGVLGLSDASVATQSGKLQVILLAAEERRMALCVDALLRESQAILKPLPFPASASPLFLGGVPLENNTIALVVNASALIDRFRGESLQARVETPQADAARRNRILVVDDSFTARTLQRSILEAAGYDVRVAVDGVEGLAEARVGGFDAVITDIQMPRMDGFQLVEAIKEDPRLKDTPVILVTSLSDEEDRERGLSLGADAYIVKQKFDHEDLLHVIRQVL